MLALLSIVMVITQQYAFAAVTGVGALLVAGFVWAQWLGGMSSSAGRLDAERLGAGRTSRFRARPVRP